MKKLIFVISKDPDAKNWNDCLTNKQNLCKMIIMDTEQDEGDADFSIVTLEPDSPNRFDQELLSDLLSPENQVYLLVCTPDNPLFGPEVFRNKNAKAVEKPTPQYFLLSERQRLIIHYLSYRFTYKDIARKMKISVHTVKHQIEIIYFKWKVKNRYAAVELYREYGPDIS
jgi:DNA-binding CsgD family transcriptional regulator